MGQGGPAWELSGPVKWTDSPAGALLSVCCTKPASREEHTLLGAMTHTQQNRFSSGVFVVWTNLLLAVLLYKCYQLNLFQN